MKKMIITSIIFFTIISLFIILLVGIVKTDIKKNRSYVNTHVVINQDTLLVVDYIILVDKYVLEDGRYISSESRELFELK